ncbi:hypothetical protein BV25DRAFT_1916289 [Artomyces pyxidatus]|uniref:Uncharacterized protein n=1 Tax=Artomyces pyxidatus TaxID=48021 RepID=A0ACB8SZU0_9AGAM|nr:hypothetical protein BV25DRAFT_1916289 [Artomyces pyxidatus]
MVLQPQKRKWSRAQRIQLETGQVDPRRDWECPRCGRWFAKKKNGAALHARRCHSAKSSTVERARHQRHDGPPGQQRAASLLREGPETAASGSSSLFSGLIEGIPWDMSDSDEDHRPLRNFAVSAAAGPSSDALSVHPQDHESLSDTSDDSDSPTTLSLRDGETLVEYHPFSGRSSEIIKSATARHPGAPDPSATREVQSLYDASTSDLPPWAPFPNQDSFRQAEIFVLRNVPDPFINEQLTFMRQSSSHTSVQFKNAAEMHALLARDISVDNMGEFESTSFTTSYRNEERTYEIRYRPALPIIHQLLEDPDLRPHLIWYPDRRYVRNPSGQPGNVRVWREVSSGDDWWNMQTAIGRDGVIIYVQLYADATVVSTFGNTKAWSVYLWLGNVPKSARKGRGKGRAVLLGYLPTVVGLKNDDPSTLAAHRVKVYHKSLAFMLESLRTPRAFGTLVDSQPRPLKGFPLVAVVSMDYEEMVRAALILGANSGYPCPICLVPRELQGDLSQTWERRTVEGTRQLVVAARSLKTKKARSAKLKEQSVRDLKNTFVEIMNPVCSIYDAFVADPLHQIEQGTFGKHLWPWIVGMLSADAQAELDENFKSLSRYPDVHHFPNGVTQLSNLSGNEHNIIARYLLPCVSGLIPEHPDAIHPLLRSQAVVLLLNKFTCHTDITLNMLTSQTQQFGDASKIIQELALDINFDWPKMHTMGHNPDIIRRKGTVDNYHTGLGEALHPQTKKDYQRTNHQPGTYEDQVSDFRNSFVKRQ